MTSQVPFFAVSVILSLLFFLYGFNHYFLLNATRKYKNKSLPENSHARPPVSIHLPVYNEKYVIRRLVTACARMAEAYGIDRVRILVLDDSNDDTVMEVDKVVREYKEKHYHIEVLRRENRSGFKAGALQAALAGTEEEFVAIFDADFVPPADFLLRSLPFFERDERLAIVQARWTYLNRDFNILTRALAILMDVHFLIEQTGRYASGCFQNFNGSGGVLRKKAVLEAGGWRGDTLAEDLDLSYRMQMRGYRVLYLRDLECPGELPPTLPGIKMQQGRWACGSLRNARLILPGLLRKREIGFKQRVEAFIHLTGYIIHPLMVCSFLLSCLTVIFGTTDPALIQTGTANPAAGAAIIAGTFSFPALQNLVWAILFPFLILCTLAPWISLVSTLQIQNLPLVRNLGGLLVLVLISLGISLSNTRAAGKALLSNRSWEFQRTPKYAHLKNKLEYRTRSYQVPMDPVWLAELIFTLMGLLSTGMALRDGNYPVLLVLVPFTISFGFVCLLSIRESGKARA